MARTPQERSVGLLEQAKRKGISHRKAAELIEVSKRWLRKLSKRMKQKSAWSRSRAARAQPDHPDFVPVYAGFGPTLAAGYLARKHQIR